MMLGAIAGHVIGSVYERNNIKTTRACYELLNMVNSGNEPKTISK